MNKNGFIATSVLYAFFLAFVTLFIGLVTIYIQNRIYLTKFEDSSKNNIYIREMKNKMNDGIAPIQISIDSEANKNVESLEGSIIKTNDEKSCNLARCDSVYLVNEMQFEAKGCPDSCK